MGKIFESIITDDLFNMFKHKISKSQHGFFKRRSTTTNMIGYTEQLHRVKDADYSILKSVHLIKSTAQKKISYLIIRRKNNQLLINQ